MLLLLGLLTLGLDAVEVSFFPEDDRFSQPEQLQTFLGGSVLYVQSTSNQIEIDSTASSSKLGLRVP